MMKRTISVICTLAMLTGLTACGPDIPDLSTKPSEAPSESSDTKTTTDETTAEATLKADVSDSHIKMAFDENFIVDADYIGPEKDETESLFCKVLEINEDDLLSIFFEGESPEIKNTTTGKSYISGKQKLEYFSTATDSRISFQRNDYDRYLNVFQGEYDSTHDSSVELGFMSSSDALDTVKKVLDRLGIEYSNKAVVESYDLSAIESLGNKGKELRKDSDDSKDPYADYKYVKEDEFYYITMYHTVDSVTVSRLSNADIGIYALVSANGIELLDVCTVLKKTEGSENGSKKTVPAETALQTLYDYYSNNHKDKQVEVKSVSFRYYAKSKEDKGGFELIPVWEIISAYKDSSDKNANNYSEIDAYTGECITDETDMPLMMYGG